MRYYIFKLVKLLLKDERVDPSADDNYALKYDEREGHSEVFLCFR